jgi:hypothetical protein
VAVALGQGADDVAQRQQAAVDADALGQAGALGAGALHALAPRQVHLHAPEMHRGIIRLASSSSSISAVREPDACSAENATRALYNGSLLAG